MQPTIQPSEIKAIKKLFLAEIATIGFLVIAHDELNELGLGGIIFLLPLLVVYGFILIAILALPVLCFNVIKINLLLNPGIPSLFGSPASLI